ncbi:MAG: response regulator transcription factor [Pseudomonadota bacterium]|nr:response regulator transcription factor [Pseudomonadota bacterium]
MATAADAYGLVVDDHPLVARGIAEFLRAHPLLADAVAVSRVDAALALVAQRGAPAIVLLDFWLAEGTARALVQALAAQAPATRVLAISGDGRPGVVDAMRAVGAHGFVGKHRPPEVFHRAVSALLSGQCWFQDDGAGAAGVRAFDQLPVSITELGLTERQGDILALLLAGQSNKRIAQETGLSEATVKEHVSAIFHRLGVRSRIEVVTRLRGHRLVPS